MARSKWRKTLNADKEKRLKAVAIDKMFGSIGSGMMFYPSLLKILPLDATIMLSLMHNASEGNADRPGQSLFDNDGLGAWIRYDHGVMQRLTGLGKARQDKIVADLIRRGFVQFRDVTGLVGVEYRTVYNEIKSALWEAEGGVTNEW